MICNHIDIPYLRYINVYPSISLLRSRYVLFRHISYIFEVIFEVIFEIIRYDLNVDQIWNKYGQICISPNQCARNGAVYARYDAHPHVPPPGSTNTLMAPHRTPPGPPRTPQGATRVSTCGNEGGLIYIEFCIWTNIYFNYIGLISSFIFNYIRFIFVGTSVPAYSFAYHIIFSFISYHT